MSCVFTTLKNVFQPNLTIQNFLMRLKEFNCKTNIKWNGQELSNKQRLENMERINELELEEIENGYLCSCCDPVLLLVSELYKTNIDHDYNGHIMKYRVDKPVKKLYFKSDYGHFWSISKSSTKKIIQNKTKGKNLGEYHPLDY